VLNPEAAKHAPTAVIRLDRHSDLEAAPRKPKRLVEALVELEDVGSAG
jgi:hypothetical protein